MSFKEITGNSSIKAYWPKKADERKEGDEIVGVYKKRMDQKRPDGTDSTLYLLETNEGLVGVNSSATIARAMEQIPTGTTVKIVYAGKQKSLKTGRVYNDFKVYMDEGEPEANVDLNNLDF